MPPTLPTAPAAPAASASSRRVSRVLTNRTSSTARLDPRDTATSPTAPPQTPSITTASSRSRSRSRTTRPIPSCFTALRTALSRFFYAATRTYNLTLLVIVILFVSVFAFSVTATIDAVKEHVSSGKDWDETTCVGRSTTLEEDSEGCPAGRSRMKLSVYKQSDYEAASSFEVLDQTNKKRVTVTPGEDGGCYNATQVASFREKYNVPDGNPFKCWVKEEIRARLTRGGYDRRERRAKLVRAIFTGITSVVFALMVLYFTVRLMVACVSRPLERDNRRSAAGGPGRVRPPRAAAAYGDAAAGAGAAGRRGRAPLSGREAEMLVLSMTRGEEQDEGGGVDTEGVCAICLETFSEEDAGKLARLPCKHEYHASCARQWFQKGTTSCPTCLRDLGEEVAEMRARIAARRAKSGAARSVAGTHGSVEGSEGREDADVVDNDHGHDAEAAGIAGATPSGSVGLAWARGTAMTGRGFPLPPHGGP